MAPVFFDRLLIPGVAFDMPDPSHSRPRLMSDSGLRNIED